MVQILQSLGIPVQTPITVRIDSIGAIFMAENATNNQRTRHIHILHQFLVDLTEQQFLDIIFVTSENNLWDSLSKNMKGEILLTLLLTNSFLIEACCGECWMCLLIDRLV